MMYRRLVQDSKNHLSSLFRMELNPTRGYFAKVLAINTQIFGWKM